MSSGSDHTILDEEGDYDSANEQERYPAEDEQERYGIETYENDHQGSPLNHVSTTSDNVAGPIFVNEPATGTPTHPPTNTHTQQY